MTEYTPQMAMDFFFAFDNATNPPWQEYNVKNGNAVPLTFAAEGPVFQTAQAFYNVSFNDFSNLAVKNSPSLLIIGELTTALVNQYLDGFGYNLQLAFEDFAQGVLFDERRNIKHPYDFWPLHCMDAIYPEEAKQYNSKPIFPNGYYAWYGAIRGQSLATVDPNGRAELLNFGRYLALAAAIQQTMKPRLIVGPSAFSGNHPATPYTNPNNPPMDKTELNKLRQRYQDMDFNQLDIAFQTGDDGRFGPNPFK